MLIINLNFFWLIVYRYKTQLKYTIKGANARFSSPQATLFSLAVYSKKKFRPSGTRLLLTSTLVYFNCSMFIILYVDILCLLKYLPVLITNYCCRCLFLGTLEERGFTRWKKSTSLLKENTKSGNVYDFPFFQDFLNKLSWTSYIPVCPSFQSKQKRKNLNTWH